ncbi:MAG: hypothetical protein MUF49_21250 [Oculatellaceae cyanobacterium Prado106]|jgi:hypothetical protein|nr:hypothetical protein [Oculatellaceae cyanobacterium Prado106]
MTNILLRPNQIGDRTTDELKQEILTLTEGRDTEPLKNKVEFHQNQLAPYFEELSRRNPFPVVQHQIPVVLGVWTPVWSTIPFHDSLPGRVHDQSYQIFRDNGYYANIARYAPGQQFALVQKFSLFQVTYDFMVLQKFSVRDNQWFIQNIGIEQAFRKRDIPLSIDEANNWFNQVIKNRNLDALAQNSASQSSMGEKTPELEKLDRNTLKKFEKTYLATPLLEHIYVDHDFRLVKTQRDPKQRPSYTIAIRRR